MINLDELARGGTLCIGKAGLEIGSSAAAKVKTVTRNTDGLEYAVNGVMPAVLADGEHSLTAATAQAINTKCIYLVCVDASGTVSTVKGTEQLTADLTAGTEVLHFPAPTADTCCIGYIKVTNTAATFTAGTTALTTVGSFVDLLAVPVAPLTS